MKQMNNFNKEITITEQYYNELLNFKQAYCELVKDIANCCIEECSSVSVAEEPLLLIVSRVNEINRRMNK